MGASVVKISGHYLDEEALLQRFARIVSRRETGLAVVHGGGKEITRLQQKLGIQPKYVDGLRVTDAATLSLVEMVLCGTVNKRLVRHLLAAGVDAQGLSGVDRGLLRAQPLRHPDADMGFTGRVDSVRASVISDLLALGVTPVIAPVCLGEGSNFNLNADTVTGAIAAAIAAREVIFISNVSGVIIKGAVAPNLTKAEAEAYIDGGEIHGGMIPKVKSALQVLAAGLPRAIITDLEGWAQRRGTALVAAR